MRIAASDMELMRPHEAAKALRITVDAVGKRAGRGKLRFITLPGGHRRFYQGEVEAIRRGQPLTDEQYAVLVREAERLVAS